MRIIPAIDIIDGKLVRLKKGDYREKTVYSDNPVEVAKSFEDSGLKYLHLVDLDGAKQGKVVNISILEQITKETNLIIDFGGGVKTKDCLKKVFDAGATQVTGGSIAVKNPEEFGSWIEEFGEDKIILGCDVKDGYVATDGWENKSKLSLDELLKIHQGAKNIICTDIKQDGTLLGVEEKFYDNLQQSFPDRNWIVSGGVASITDLYNAQKINVFGVIIGKAIYENRISLKELREFL